MEQIVVRLVRRLCQTVQLVMMLALVHSAQLASLSMTVNNVQVVVFSQVVRNAPQQLSALNATQIHSSNKTIPAKHVLPP